MGSRATFPSSVAGCLPPSSDGVHPPPASDVGCIDAARPGRRPATPRSHTDRARRPSPRDRDARGPRRPGDDPSAQPSLTGLGGPRGVRLRNPRFWLRTVATLPRVSKPHVCLCPVGPPYNWETSPPLLNPSPRKEMRLHPQPSVVRIRGHRCDGGVEAPRRPEAHIQGPSHITLCIVVRSRRRRMPSAGLAERKRRSKRNC